MSEVDDGKVVVEGHMDELEVLFDGAPPFQIELDYMEMGHILSAFQAAGMYGLITGEFDSDEILEAVDPIKAKFQTAMQGWLDQNPPKEAVCQG